MTVPLLRLSQSARIGPRGISRARAEVPVQDVVFMAALHSGLDPQQVTETLSGPMGAVLRALQRIGALVWDLPGVATLEVLAPRLPLTLPTQRPGPARLSRFAVLRRDGDGTHPWLLESGLSQYRLRLTDAGMVHMSGGTGWLGGLLDLAGLLDSQDARAEGWSVHDLLFQARTRPSMELRDPPARQRGVPPEPVQPEAAPLAVQLPPAAGPSPDEPSLWEATESRRTRRDFTSAPVTLACLGALLWRTLRVTGRQAADPADPLAYDVVLRPVPSGGSMHASDLWLLCRDVEGLRPGVYRYDPVRHGLVDVGGRLPTELPAPVVGIITARHKRTAWKYEPFALALELKDLGVQLMALQLSAPTVGLGVVPIGTGGTDEIGDALGVDPLVDVPIGEFLLGVLDA